MSVLLAAWGVGMFAAGLLGFGIGWRISEQEERA